MELINQMVRRALMPGQKAWRHQITARARRWFSRYSIENYLLAGIVAAGVFLLYMILRTDFVLYRSDLNGSRLYLLSSIVPGLAAILALLVTLSLVATQLAAAAYTPRLVARRLTDFWLWSAVVIYLAAIGWSLLVLGGLGNWLPPDEKYATNVALILALVSLAYLAPFTIATLKSLQPDRMVAWLVARDDLISLDDMMRKAVNDGSMTLLIPTLSLFRDRAIKRLRSSEEPLKEAKRFALVFLSVGRHSCQRRSPDAVAAVMEKLTELTRYCNEPPRNWREAADIFNDTIKELYVYAEEWLGGS